MTDVYLDVLRQAKELEQRLRACGETLGPFRVQATGYRWRYHHAEYYEDRYVRVIGAYFQPTRLEDCSHDTRVRVINDIL